MQELARKRWMARILKSCELFYPLEFNFVPETLYIPEDLGMNSCGNSDPLSCMPASRLMHMGKGLLGFWYFSATIKTFRHEHSYYGQQRHHSSTSDSVRRFFTGDGSNATMMTKGSGRALSGSAKSVCINSTTSVKHTNVFILKPDAGSQAVGIQLVDRYGAYS